MIKFRDDLQGLHMFDVPRKKPTYYPRFMLNRKSMEDFYPDDPDNKLYLPSYKDPDDRRTYYQESSDVMELVLECA